MGWNQHRKFIYSGSVAKHDIYIAAISQIVFNRMRKDCTFTGFVCKNKHNYLAGEFWTFTSGSLAMHE